MVGTFPSGEEFLEWLRTHSPDCVVLDLHMPRMTGFDVLTGCGQERYGCAGDHHYRP